MTAQETNLLNAYESTLTGTIGASDLTLTVNAVVDSASNTLTAPCYLVVNPDSATNREVILVNSINVGTKTLTISAIGDRYLTGSAATSGLSHASGSVIRMSPLQQHIEDVNDRVDTIINEDGTSVNTTLFLDEDDMSSDSPTKGVTQQSVKAYVDSQVTAQDLDFAGGTGTGQVDLDSQTFTIAGTTNEIETSASGQTLTIGLPSSITVDVTGDLTGNVTATSVLADGVTATTQSTGDNSTKVATTAYVDASLSDDNLTVSDGTTSTTIDLDTQTFSILGTANEITAQTSAQTITIGLPSDITVNVTGQVSDISNHSTTDLSEGTNLYYTTARFDTAFSGKSTTDLSEGTNLYYTTTRANTDIDARVTKSFVDALNVDADTLDGNDSTAFATSAQGTLADSALQPTDSIGDLSDVDITTVAPTNGQVLVWNDTNTEFEPGSVGSASALVDGTSDLTLTDGTGLDYDISGTDVGSWEAGGIALTADGGIFRHNQTQSATYTVASTEGAVLAGPITIEGTITNAGTMVIL
jgi:hypothetical protein